LGLGQARGKLPHREVLVEFVRQGLGIPVDDRLLVVEDQGQVGDGIQATLQAESPL